MNLKQLLEDRKSTRAFLDKPVELSLVEEILDAARHSPSGVNTQPWQVAVVTGNTKAELTAEMEAAFRGGEKGQMDYQYYPLEWQGDYKERRKDCGLRMYSALAIERGDKQRQMDQWAANYRGFDAPVMLFFLMDGVMETGSFLDYGMFLQSVMLMAQEKGLSTCPQAALGEYPKIVKKKLGYADDMILLCGMSMGYEDSTAAVNSYRTPRQEVTEFTQIFE